MSEDILVARHDGIVTATLNRPRSRNALTYEMYDALAALCREIDAETETKALILTGAGEEAFAAGTDISLFQDFSTEADSLAYEARIERALTTLETCRVPTIAAIAGACTGGGAMIAASCDLRIAAPNMRFGFPIAKTLGNCLSSQNLARLVALFGEARVKQMIFTAGLMGADEGLASGLVVGVSETSASLVAEAEDLARTVAAHAPLTIAATKQALRRLRPPVVPADDLVLSCYMSADFHEGVAAFLARRKPQWTGS